MEELHFPIRSFGKFEEIQLFGCTFRVYRKSIHDKIFTLSLWKSDLGYIFNLSNSILWYVSKFPKLFPNWGIRIYVDNSIFSTKNDQIEWDKIIEEIIQTEHIELWFFSCPWAHDKKCIGCHRKTFPSVVRFHAFDDPDVKIAVCRNIEYLSSERDVILLNRWIDSGKRYNYYCPWNETGMYICIAHPEISIPNKMHGKPSLIATFAINKIDNVQEGIITLDTMSFLMNDENNLHNFRFGVDEILLTKIVKPKMTEENTFVTSMWFDLSPLFNCFPQAGMENVFRQLMEYYKTDETNLRTNRPILFRFLNDVIKYIYTRYKDEDEKMSGEDYEKCREEWERKFMTFFHSCLFDMFKTVKKFDPILLFGRYYNATIENIEKQTHQKIGFNEMAVKKMFRLMMVAILKNTLLNCLDFPGACIKTKDFSEEPILPLPHLFDQIITHKDKLTKDLTSLGIDPKIFEDITDDNIVDKYLQFIRLGRPDGDERSQDPTDIHKKLLEISRKVKYSQLPHFTDVVTQVYLR